MRRHQEPMRLAARWSVRPLDFDPLRRPVSYALSVAGSLGRWLLARDHVALHGSRVGIARRVLGVAVRRIEISLDDFQGLAVRMQNAGDDLLISVNLHHNDPDLCLPLFVGSGMDMVGVRWRELGRVLGLPLLVRNDEGEFVPMAAKAEAVAATPAYPRRKSLAHRLRTCAVGRPSYWFPTITPEGA